MATDRLLEAIRARGQKQTAFAFGILTADRYVRTLEEYAGPDICNRIAAKGRGSFHDLLTKAASTLVYSNEDMRLAGISFDKRVNGSVHKMELPKNTLMSFRHVLTSSRQDRDGDTLHSDGGIVDPKMLLLWQHVHTMPIGKYLITVDQSGAKMVVESCIVDVNSLCHDAAVMVDNDMGRFSHGFRALEFTERKTGRGDAGGFDITKFEIMEESLVSVPANVDAQTEEVILSLVEGGKLTSPVMKHFGRGIRKRRSVQVPGVEIKYREVVGDCRKELVCRSLADLKSAADAGLIGGKSNENESGNGSQAGAGGEVPAITPEEADADAGADEAKAAANKEVTGSEKGWVCPDLLPQSYEWITYQLGLSVSAYLTRADAMLGGRAVIFSTFPDRAVAVVYPPPTSSCCEGSCYAASHEDLTFYEIDWSMVEDAPTLSGDPRQVQISLSVDAVKRLSEIIEKTNSSGGEKAGRALNKVNEQHIRDAMANHDEVMGLEDKYASRTAKALVKEANSHCKAVLDSMPSEGESTVENITAKTAMAAFITAAATEERKQLADILAAFSHNENDEALAKQYRAAIGQ